MVTVIIVLLIPVVIIKLLSDVEHAEKPNKLISLLAAAFISKTAKTSPEL